MCMWHVWGERKCVQAFCLGHLIERDHLEYLALEVRIILRTGIEETELKSVDWINVAQDRDSRQVVVNMVMNLMSHKMRAICRLAEELLASQKGICFFFELVDWLALTRYVFSIFIIYAICVLCEVKTEFLFRCT